LHEKKAGADAGAVPAVLERPALHCAHRARGGPDRRYTLREERDPHRRGNTLVKETRGTRDPYDGVLEYWWDNAAHLVERTESPEGRALTGEMLAFQRQFVDLTSSTAFFVEG
jgi:hypothetical protein